MIRSIKVGVKKFKACRIFCIGKNYEEHIRELGDGDTPSQPQEEVQPIVFMKPVTSSPDPMVPAKIPVPVR